MNFLFDFLKNLDSQRLEKLRSLTFRGAKGRVWQLLNQQSRKGVLDKDKALHELGITTSHFDKITSELLAKCYQFLFGDDSLALLGFLSNHMLYVKLFYSELNKQLKLNAGRLNKKDQAAFYRNCFSIIQSNLPIASRDNTSSQKLATRYVALFKGREKKEAALFMTCRLLLEKMQVLFAAGHIHDAADALECELNELNPPEPGYSAESVFEYYWTKMYFYHAVEKFETALQIANLALLALKNFDTTANTINKIRIDLKINEFLYYLSRFDEAFLNYNKLINSEWIDRIPERAYHVTKYIQLCLVTDHITEAGEILEQKLNNMGERMEQMITPRDIVTCVKYYLLNDQYEHAFRFLQLGFEKNPKGKYFQYEIELRNLQVAYFFLTGKGETALELCPRNIKYLRNHGYGVQNSPFPHFYLLTKAIFEKKTGGKLAARHSQMLDRYQQGSYALYGRLLLKMLNCRA